MLDQPDIVIHRRDSIQLGVNDSSLRRFVRDGELVRIVRGTYADSETWDELSSGARHRARVLAVAERLRTQVVFSHFAAAALWGMRLLGDWPQMVDVTLERASGGRSDGALRRHCTGLESTEVTSIDGLLVTSPAQTVVDLAKGLPFPDAVVVADSALHRRRQPQPLTTPDAIERAVAMSEGKRGYRKAWAVADFATALSDSPAESHSRVQLHLLGFPKPELQREFRLPGGGRAFVDFFWEEFSHIGECDGASKYADPAILNGRTPRQVLLDEKRRENELRRLVKGFSRWDAVEPYTPARLFDRLTFDGLPSSRRRPSPSRG